MSTAPEPAIPAHATHAAHDWATELRHVRERLRDEFGSELPSGTIDRCVGAEAAKLEAARISIYVPILVEKNARTRLRAYQLREIRAT